MCVCERERESESEWRSEGEEGEVGEREGVKEWVRGWRKERLRV